MRYRLTQHNNHYNFEVLLLSCPELAGVNTMIEY